jgi:hypothetical protein
MITFLSQESDCAGMLAKTKTPTRLILRHKLHHQFALMHTKHDKRGATIFESRCSRTVLCYRFDRVEAEPLVRTRFLRLANSLPKSARSLARRSRDVRETSGKKSGEISRVMSRNVAAMATAMVPSVRQDDSQANLSCAGLGRVMSARKLARRLATWSGYSRATVKATSRKTTRSNLNHDIQRL